MYLICKDFSMLTGQTGLLPDQSTNKGGYRRPEKSRKWDSLFFSACSSVCASHAIWLTACLFLVADT